MKQVFVTTAFAIASAALVFGCASETTGPNSETGNVGVNLMVGGNDVTAVNFEVTCSDSTVCPLNGQFNVIDRGPNEPPIWATIMDLPVGVPDPIVYTINLTALDDQGVVLCTGSADFTVNELEPTKVNMVLECGGDGEELLGSVDIDATFRIIDGNRCPRLHFLNAVPIDVPAEGSEVTVLVSDADEDPLTTALTTPGGGSFADPAAQSTTYFCDNASGAQTISVTVSDGVEACNKSKSFDVVCPGDNNLCEGVDCDDNNECTTDSCDSASGACVNEPVGSSPSCEVAQLAVNGGFEQGDGLPGWTQFCESNGGTCEATTAPLPTNTGFWSGNVSSPEGRNPLIKQERVGVGIVQPVSQVAISFDLLGERTGESCGVIAQFFSETDGGPVSKVENLGRFVPTAEWVTYPFTVTTGDDVSGGVTLQLVAECGAIAGDSINVYFDNVSITTQASGGICNNAGVCAPPTVVCEDPLTDCPPTNNECIDPVCNAGTCGTSNNTNACDGDAGTCDGQGNCVPNAEVFYEQDFESLDQASTTALGDAPPAGAGFLVFGNEYTPAGEFIFGYGTFPAPNNPAAAAFSLIAAGEGGAEQGAQQLVIISDYQNSAQMTAGNLVEANTFQEPFTETEPITAADFGTYTFSFDAKLGDLVSPSTALAFIKTLDPNAGFATTRFVTVDTTGIPNTWARYSITLVVDAALLGQILQFGFSATTTNFVASGVFYDNLLVTVE